MPLYRWMYIAALSQICWANHVGRLESSVIIYSPRQIYPDRISGSIRGQFRPSRSRFRCLVPDGRSRPGASRLSAKAAYLLVGRPLSSRRSLLLRRSSPFPSSVAAGSWGFAYVDAVRRSNDGITMVAALSERP